MSTYTALNPYVCTTDGYAKCICVSGETGALTICDANGTELGGIANRNAGAGSQQMTYVKKGFKLYTSGSIFTSLFIPLT